MLKQRKKDTHRVVQVVAEEAVAGIEAEGFIAPAGDTDIFYGNEADCLALRTTVSRSNTFEGVTYAVRPVVPS